MLRWNTSATASVLEDMGILLEVFGELVGEVVEALVRSLFGKRTDTKREKDKA